MNRLSCTSYVEICQRLATHLVLLLAATGTHGTAKANELDGTAARLLPKTVIAFAEMPSLGETVATIFNHPLRQRLVAMPAYAAVSESDGFAKLKIGVNAFEGTMKQPWQEALKALTDGGVTVALDASEGGMALLVRSSDQDALKRFREFLLALRLLGGKSSNPIEYRGFKTDALGDDLRMAWVDNWLIVSNKPQLGKAIVDRYVDGGDDTLNSNERFQLAFNQRAETARPDMFGYLDVGSVREGGIAKDVFNERSDNFFAEVVLGGVLANIRHTPYATFQLDVENAGLKLKLATPHNRSWEPPREYYFGVPTDGAAPPLLNVNDRLFALSAHRDMSQMWLRSGDLLNERASDELAKADTQLTTFFSGRDFGEDILGSLENDIQFVGKPQDFSERLPQPAVKLPAFAIQFRMKDPDTTQSELRRIFQSFVGFLNIIGAMEGRPQFDLGTESLGDAKLHTATYVPNIDERESVTAPINFNFSPTLAFTADDVILSSAIPLARELVAANNEHGGGHSGSEAQINTAAIVDAEMLQQILKDNQSQLVANSMLEKGQSKESAEGEIGLLLDLIGFIQEAALSLEVTDSQLQLNFAVNVDNGQ